MLPSRRASPSSLVSLAAVLGWTSACAPGPATPPPAAPPTAAEAKAFIDKAEAALFDVWVEADKVEWVKSTYITDDTDWLSARATEKELGLKRQFIDESRRFDGLIASGTLPPDVSRRIQLLRLGTTMPSPADPAARKELAEITTELESTYGKGKVCLDPKKPDDCIDLNGASRILAESRDYDQLLATWKGWHAISPPMRARYQRFVALSNTGAKEIGYADTGALWRSGYDMSAADFEAEVERLWTQVKPLYDALHCYVRKRLSAHYGAEKVPKTGPIPAHLLGNMWAQEWGGIYPLVEPYPGVASLDVTAKMVKDKWDAARMMRTGESFYTSLGFPSLPETFWSRSMITKPRDREVVCHASAWDMGGTNDVRIKMCTETTEDDLYTIHHELGHVYYYLSYYTLPPLYRRGAHDGFHEGIGDTLVLSVTPTYLKQLGLLDKISAADDPKATVNTLMKRALDKIAFLPFGKLIDQWRWQVFDGRVPPERYNQAWWDLKKQYQGIAPPGARSESDFDPGAKYHVAANVPYTRYFLAHILQFQFHRALCKAAGYEGPLYNCSIFGNKAAGEKLAAMLALGQSKPWPEALATLSGERQMDASAVLEYFAPLAEFLKKENEGEQCGW